MDLKYPYKKQKIFYKLFKIIEEVNLNIQKNKKKKYS
jgi:hypothetical protein